MTVLIAVVHVWPTMVVEIFACAFHTILKATTLNVAALSLSHILSATVWVAHLAVILALWLLRSAHEMGNALLVTAAKSIPVRFTLFGWKPWVAVLVAIVHVWAAVIVEVLACAFDPVVKTLPLNILQFLRRRIPAAAILGISGGG